MSRRRAPIHYRHLRKLHAAILIAAETDDWKLAETLFRRMPMQYQAIAHLCVWQKRLGASA